MSKSIWEMAQIYQFTILLPPPFIPSYFLKLFLLDHRLHVPSITKKLFNVSKFEADNSVYFELSPNHYHVKDQATKKILVVGKLNDSLYVFDPYQSTSHHRKPVLLLNMLVYLLVLLRNLIVLCIRTLFL